VHCSPRYWLAEPYSRLGRTFKKLLNAKRPLAAGTARRKSSEALLVKPYFSIMDGADKVRATREDGVMLFLVLSRAQLFITLIIGGLTIALGETLRRRMPLSISSARRTVTRRPSAAQRFGFFTATQLACAAGGVVSAVSTGTTTRLMPSKPAGTAKFRICEPRRTVSMRNPEIGLAIRSRRRLTEVTF
jgi:hypothetical protein